MVIATRRGMDPIDFHRYYEREYYTRDREVYNELLVLVPNAVVAKYLLLDINIPLELEENKATEKEMHHIYHLRLRGHPSKAVIEFCRKNEGIDILAYGDTGFYSVNNKPIRRDEGFIDSFHI